MAKAAFYTVAESFIGALDGAEVEYHKGETVDADDPAFKQWPSLFVPLVLREHRRGEQATAAPGEKRGGEPAPAGKAITTASFKGL